MYYKILELDLDAKYPIRLLAIVDAECKSFARTKAANALRNEKILHPDYCEIIAISYDDFDKKKKQLSKELRKYNNIIRGF